MATPQLPADLVRGLVAATELLQSARHDWWIIAGAAVALYGVAPVVVGDIDVLLTPDDVSAVASIPGLRIFQPAYHPRFRSGFHGSIDVGGVVVEFMADFAVHDGTAWSRILPASRHRVVVEGAVLYVPSRADLVAMLARFGRPKDLERIALLTR